MLWVDMFLVIAIFFVEIMRVHSNMDNWISGCTEKKTLFLCSLFYVTIYFGCEDLVNF